MILKSTRLLHTTPELLAENTKKKPDDLLRWQCHRQPADWDGHLGLVSRHPVG